MKPTSSEMQSSPPRLLEAVIGWLIPPSHRDILLGDLYEEYRSPVSYVRDALRILPFVVFSQIRRTLDYRLLMLQAVAFLVSFQLAWNIVDGFQPVAQPQIAVLPAVIVSLAALVLCRAYAHDRSRLRAATNAVIALLSASVAELMVMFVVPPLLLPPWVMLLAAIFSVALLSLTARLNPERIGGTVKAKKGVNRPELERKARAFHHRARQFNRLEQCVTVVVFLVFSGALWLGSELWPRMGWSLMMLVSVCATCRAGSREWERRLPLSISWERYRVSHQRQLERERALLRSVSSRYLAPLVVSFTFLLLAAAVQYAGLVPTGIPALLVLGCFGVMLGAARLIRSRGLHAASRLDGEIEAVDQLK